MNTPAAPALALMPAAWREILQYLKMHGEARADALAGHLGITPSGLRQHLAVLGRDGLVQHRELREGPGRPKHLYALTGLADALFPRAYAELTNELLDYADDEDAELVGRLFERRAERRLQGAIGRLEDKPFGAKVAEVARILDEDGYLADFEAMPDGSYRLREHNCMVLGVAKRFGHACSSEIDFLRRALPEADVQRVQHMLAGSHACAYEIRLKA
ncbi:MAG: putative transcriptional regulator [Cyanobacteria bacterium RYN_339]|nr:putative transcriptional regulator [Cyanobacteria bacterium RYN_339]